MAAGSHERESSIFVSCGDNPFYEKELQGTRCFQVEYFSKNSRGQEAGLYSEAQELCPKRLYGYLNPGTTQQTNKKIKAEFMIYLREKLTIGLDICNIHELKFGESVLGKEALEINILDN